MSEHPSKPHAATDADRHTVPEVESTLDPDADHQDAHHRLVTYLRRIESLASTLRLLRWDQQVSMPSGGGTHRVGQFAELARLLHERWASPMLGELIAASEAQMSSQTSVGVDTDSKVGTERNDSTESADGAEQAVIVRETRRRHERARRVPVTLVAELAEAKGASFEAWRAARHAGDFKMFRPALERVMKLVQRRAACLGWPEEGEAWDALADEYEPGCTARQVDALFDELTPRLSALFDTLRGGRASNAAEALTHAPLSAEAQHAFMRHVATRFGFDFVRGRLDPTIHPFCTRIGPGDVRLTVAHREDDLRRGLGSLTHETGHGLYEQSLPEAHTGTPLCEPASLGLHEGMARLWENHVGRSQAFCRWCVDAMPGFFGKAIASVDSETLFAARNRVAASLIRTQADELTYHLHVAVRFELERAMLNGDLSVSDLPQAWNERYREHLDVEPPDDVEGCMQDVHWAGGMVGYFPSYTFGSLYAAQYFEAAERELGGLAAAFEAGEFEPLRAWLADRVCRHGRRYGAAELCERVTGEALSVEPMLRHLEAKLRPLYGVA